MRQLVSACRQGLCTYLTLNRPDTGNALNAGLVTALNLSLREAEADGAALVVLEGAGKHFSTGMDLADLDTMTDDSLLARFVAIERMLARVWAAPFLTVAVAHGRSMGAGADLFAACDYRLATPDSRFAFPGAGFGLVLGTRRLGVRVGPDRAMDLALSGRTVTADEARDMRLATAVVAPENIGEAVEGITATATRCPPDTVRRIKRAAYSGHGDPDGDLAALTRSAAEPGLKQRIIAHRDRVLSRRKVREA